MPTSSRSNCRPITRTNSLRPHKERWCRCNPNRWGRCAVSVDTRRRALKEADMLRQRTRLPSVAAVPADGTQATSRPRAVSISNVSKRFFSRAETVHAVDDVTLTIEAGEFVTIVGPSGCGKSTLLDMIAGLLAPSEGSIDVLGRRVTGPVHELGIGFQQHLLLPWRTILQNVMLQVEVRHRKTTEYLHRARALLERVGIAEFANRYPDELSGGMNQRAAICRALIH